MDIVGRAVGSARRTAVSSVDVLGSFLAAASAALSTYARLHTGAGNSADVALFDAAVWATQESWFGDGHRPAPRLVRVEDGVVVLDGPGAVRRRARSPGCSRPRLWSGFRRAPPRRNERHQASAGRRPRHDRRTVSRWRGRPDHREPPALPAAGRTATGSRPGRSGRLYLANRHIIMAGRSTMTASSPTQPDLEDILYEVKDGIATITINRARVRNASGPGLTRSSRRQ